MTPPMGGNCIPLMFQRFTVAILKIETRSENKKCSICPQITFSFSDHLDYLTHPPTPRPNQRVKQRQDGIKLFQVDEDRVYEYTKPFFCDHPQMELLFSFQVQCGNKLLTSRGFKVKFLKMLQPEKELVDAISYLQFINGRPPRFIYP